MITSSPNTQRPTTNGRPAGKKKCLAVLQLDKLTVCLKYEFFMTETEQFFASGDEHCEPTVSHMMQTLLPKHFAMSMEELTEKFDLQLQHLDIEFVPPEFIDIDPREWCAELVKDRGKYKVLLQPKLDNNSASRIVDARKNVPENVGVSGRRLDDGPVSGQRNANREGGRCLEDEDVPMEMVDRKCLILAEAANVRKWGMKFLHIMAAKVGPQMSGHGLTKAD
uniref:Uncharacterized protein n=1 Tax=Globodera rostochiensis TaxID=31243 RepID=A0A914HDA5_GLORO